jgi:RimJ/RimL family protein N-acetyltransferase
MSRSVLLPERAPVLRADGLTLRPWETSDAEFVLELGADPETLRWAPNFRGLTSREHALRWIAERRSRVTMWVVCDSTGSTGGSSGTAVGWVGLSYLEPEERSMMISYGAAAGARRQGVTRRAVDAVTAYCFDPAGLGLVRVSLEHAVANRASCRVATGAGYRVEGTLRQRILGVGGGLDDSHAHARLASDPSVDELPVEAEPEPIEPVEIAAGTYQLCIPDPELDAAAVLAACDDDDIRRWNAGPATLAAARLWCANRGDWTDGGHLSWLVKDTSGTLLGAISVFQINRRSLSGQAGYWVAPTARGRGVASAALSAASRFAYDGVGLTRIELYHAVDNPASCRTAERAGFAREGVHRQSYRYGDGLLHDEHSHARLATD